MRWLGLTASVLLAMGCTVHVVESPTAPLVVAEPVHAHQPPRVAARPTRVERVRPSRPRPVVVAPALPPRRVVEKPPRTLRPTEVVDVRKPPRPRAPQKRRRIDHIAASSKDVEAMERNPDPGQEPDMAASARVAKPQQNALNLRK
jgi:hypothetical protein